jgi:hypothetical protein
VRYPSLAFFIFLFFFFCERLAHRVVNLEITAGQFKTIADLPAPLDSSVKLREVPAHKLTVRVFRGVANKARVHEESRILADALKADGITPAVDKIEDYELAQFNPPWCLGWLRTNEVRVGIKEDQ